MPMSELEILAHIDRELLYSFVWDIPAEVLAERMGVSIDSLNISCANRGIPMPDDGYWMKKSAGMHPTKPPLTERRPGPYGTTGTVDEAIQDTKTAVDDPIATIDNLLGAGTIELIARTAKGIVIDPDASLRPHLKWQRDVCSSDRKLEQWLERNEASYNCLWLYASPSSVARMCAILEAMGRAAESLGGTYDEHGFDIFGEKVHVNFSEHLGKYRKGQKPSRTYNGLLSMYIGMEVFKDYRKKNLEQDVPRAFMQLCLNAAYQAKARREALEALIETRSRYASRQASIAAENERRKAFNREVDRYEEALRLADAHARAERLRSYARALEAVGRVDDASWVMAKADWADPITRTPDDIFGKERTPDGTPPPKKKQIPYETKGIEADGFFGQPIGDPSPTLEAYKRILQEREAQDNE